MAEQVKGYLVVKVLEAAGHDGNDAVVWDDTFTDAFVKIEIRGGPRTIKKQTSLQKVVDNIVCWEEQLALEHLDGSGELRILLCRPKPEGKGSSILAACGIYVRDILEAVPIDKYFELFKPGEGSEGGFIRISMDYLMPDQVRNVDGLLNGGVAEAKKGGLLPKVLLGMLAAAVLVGGALAARSHHRRQSEGKQAEAKAAETRKAAGGKGLPWGVKK